MINKNTKTEHITKKIIALILVLPLMSCINFTVKSSNVAGKITRLNREMPQVKADLELKKQLEKSIESGKKNFLYSNASSEVHFGRYYIDIVEGRVLLSGSVANNEIKKYIISKITENIKVRELLDELAVGDVKINTVNDFFIKRSIMTKIFFRTKIKSLNYEIRVVNGNTYIIGIAEDEEEMRLLANAISTVKGVKEVISYVITMEHNKKIKLEFL